MDSLWYESRRNPEPTVEAARAFRQKAIANGDYDAEVNGTQIMGECYFYLGDIDSSRYYYDIAMEMSVEMEDLFEIGNNHASLATIAMDVGEFETAMYHYEEAIKAQEERGSIEDLCDVYLRMGHLFMDTDKLDDAMSAYLKSVNYCKECGNEAFRAYSIDGMGTLHKKQGNIEKAIEVYQEAFEVYTAIQDTIGLCGYYNNMGIIYKNEGSFEQSYDYFTKGFEMIKTQSYPRGEMSFQSNMGNLANRMGNPEMALEHLRAALVTAKPAGIKVTISDVSDQMARSFMALNQPDSARVYAKQSVEYALKGRHLEKVYEGYLTQSELHESQGEYPEALAAYKNYAQYQDSVINNEKAAEVDRLQTIYETEKREKEIIELESASKLKTASNRLLAAVLAGVILVASLLIITIVVKRRRDRQLHAAQLDLERIEKARLGEQLDYKQKELTSKVLHIAQKNEMLSELKSDLEKMKQSESGSLEIEALNRKLKFEERIDKNWDQFTRTFTETNQEFIKTLATRYPGLSKGEIRLVSLIQMQLSSKEIATVLNISDEGVKKSRYRLRKKLSLESSESLEAHLAQL